MADRVSASIVIGGRLSRAAYEELASIIADELLSIEWDGEPFLPEHRIVGQPLSLFAHEVAWGRFDALENWCVANAIAFARWSGAFPGQWGAERMVFTGEGDPKPYACDEDNYVVIGRGTAERLGSMEAIMTHFDAADFIVPPLIVDGDEPAPG